jgi:hypothetical protein
MPKFKVQVIERKTGEVIKEIECASERSANKVEDGMLINMNYESYYTQVVDVDMVEALRGKASGG